MMKTQLVEMEVEREKNIVKLRLILKKIYIIKVLTLMHFKVYFNSNYKNEILFKIN